MVKLVQCHGIFLSALLLPLLPAGAAKTFSVATYNVENYVTLPGTGRPIKSAEAKQKVCEGILTLKAEVLALQEIGGKDALLELRNDLKQKGLDYPHWELVHGWDTNIQVAVLSQFPFVERRPHTNETFLLNGRRFHVSRGFAEVTIEVNPNYRFTLFNAHLKSKLATAAADEAELRAEEALLLREKIEERLKTEPNLNLVVLGDLNDTKAARPIRTILGHGYRSLVDTRPAEANSDLVGGAGLDNAVRTITWTHYFAREDTYSRHDYILLSRAMAQEWMPSKTYVLTSANWGMASDHRPVVAGFVAEEK
jgi:endonuclease/exonuclease/phosphatase family metal-dependent hydrolase